MIKLSAVKELEEGQSKGFKVADQSILVVKKYGDIHVYENRCPHLGIQMEMMPDQFLDSSRSLIICAMHGALFRIEDGQCVSGPCLSDKLTAIDFEINNGDIYVTENKIE